MFSHSPDQKKLNMKIIVHINVCVIQKPNIQTDMRPMWTIKSTQSSLSNSASVERRKSDVTLVCFRTSNPRNTNTRTSAICSIIASMTVQITHYYHTVDVKWPYRVIKQPINTVLIVTTANSEHRGRRNKVGNGYLYWLLQSTATVQI